MTAGYHRHRRSILCDLMRGKRLEFAAWVGRIESVVHDGVMSCLLLLKLE